jgi:hypothetical protein
MVIFDINIFLGFKAMENKGGDEILKYLPFQPGTCFFTLK